MVGANKEGAPKVDADQLEAAGLAGALIVDDEPTNDEGDAQAAADPVDRAKFVGVVAKMLHVVFGLVAKRRGAHWALDTSEAVALAEPTVDLLDKYDVAPESVEGRFIFAACVVVGPRLIADASKQRELPRDVELDEEEGF